MRLNVWSDRRGNAAMLFAVSSLPVVGLVGMAIDYTRTTSLRTRMQAAVDAAVLTYAPRAGQANLQQDIQTQVAALLDSAKVTNLGVTVTTTATSLRAEARATVPRVMAILGAPTTPISATSTASWGTQSLEVALVIDNTGSMAEAIGGTTKIAAVTTAATNLVSFLNSSVTGGSTLKIAVVPFDTDVNVGSGNLGAAWIDTSALPAGSTWQGCVWDRDQNYDVSNTAPTSASTAYQPDPARTASCNVAPMLPLTHSMGTVNGAIGSMSAAGYTNLTVGLSWGFSMLTPNAPFSGAVPFGTPGVYKSLVFMTDGQNTQNRWSTTASAINARTQMACAAIKAAGIEIYTVGTVDADASVLQSCATDPSMSYQVTTGSEMNAAFADIASKISRLRLSR